MGVRRARGEKRAFAPRLEIGIMKHLFLEKPEVDILIPIYWFDSCNDLFLPVWNSHCTRVSFTVIVSCSDELGFFYCWYLLRTNNMATNLQRFTLYYGGRCFVAWDCWTQTSWQVMQRDSDMPIALSYVHLYFVKRSMSESILAMLP